MIRFTVHPDLSPDLTRHFRKHHRELFERAHLISTSDGQVTKEFTYHNQHFIIKRYLEKGIRAWLRAVIGLNRAMNSFRRARELTRAGVRTPRHLMVACHPAWFRATSFLIIEKSPGEQLYALIFAKPKRRIPRKVLENVATLTDRMHRAGLSHGDLHSRNLLVLPDQSVEVIDLDGMDHRKRRQKKDRSRLVNSFRGRRKKKRHLAEFLEEKSS